MYRDGSAHNGTNRAETILSPVNVAGLHIAHAYPNWVPALDESSQIIVGSLGYSVDEGSHQEPYCGGVCNGFIWAFHLPSGAPAWHHKVYSGGHLHHYVPAVSAGGVLYVGGASAMYAFNAANGSALWTTPVGELFEQTTVASNGIVYAAGLYGSIYAFDGASGRILWSAKPSGCCANGAVTVAGGLAYFSTGHLFAYNAKSGAPVFTSTATTEAAGTVAVSGGVAYVQGLHQLAAFNASTGSLLWSSVTELGGAYHSLAPAVDGGTVVVSTPRYLIAFAASTGARLWTVDSGTDYTGYSEPAIANGLVYTGSGLGLQATSEASGQVLFSSGSSCLIPTVSHSAVYATCMGSVYPYDWEMTVFTL
jgi:outer membrane protein assembly factor BamB